jgi:hypothetical protein
MKTLNIGNVTVDRVQDWKGAVFHVPDTWPGSTWEAVEAQRDWLEPHFFAPKGQGRDGVLDCSLHTYIIRTPHFNVLVDTCVGNDRQRAAIPTGT